MMSRKDYVALAACIQEDNPRFDRSRFLVACGVTE